MNSYTANSNGEIKVLAVDDNSDFLELLERKLDLHSDNCMDVKTMTEPEKALEELGKKQYDVVVIDYLMPEMNGLELLEQIRTNYGQIPIIVETSNCRPELERELYNKGATAVMRKSSEENHYGGLIKSIKNESEHYRACKELEN